MLRGSGEPPEKFTRFGSEPPRPRAPAGRRFAAEEKSASNRVVSVCAIVPSLPALSRLTGLSKTRQSYRHPPPPSRAPCILMAEPRQHHYAPLQSLCGGISVVTGAGHP